MEEKVRELKFTLQTSPKIVPRRAAGLSGTIYIWLKNSGRVEIRIADIQADGSAGKAFSAARPAKCRKV